LKEGVRLAVEGYKAAKAMEEVKKETTEKEKTPFPA